MCAYALMSSHVHLVMEGGERPLGAFLHRLNTSYALWFNRATGNYGPVFAERPFSQPATDAETLGRFVAYVHNNPVRAGVVSSPEASTWTSHRAFVAEASGPRFLDVEWTLAALGFSASSAGRAAFHRYVCARAPLARDPRLDGPGPSSVRHAEKLVTVAAKTWCVDRSALRLPCGDRRMTQQRLHLTAVALEVVGLRADHFASALGVSKALVTRLRREAAMQDWQSAELLEAYLAA